MSRSKCPNSRVRSLPNRSGDGIPTMWLRTVPSRGASAATGTTASSSALSDFEEASSRSLYRATAGINEPPTFLTASSTLGLFGEEPEPVLHARFAQFIAGQGEDPVFLDRMRSTERVLGSKAFRDSVRQAADVQGVRVQVEKCVPVGNLLATT